MEHWILVPILTEKEHEDDFLKGLGDAQRVVLVFVIDKENLDVPAGVVGGKIKGAETTMSGIKKKLHGLEFKEYVEWGSWLQKIESIARLERVDEVVMVSTPASQALAEQLGQHGVKARVV